MSGGWSGAARPRRGHLDPACALVDAPGVGHADRDRAARVRLELDAAAVEVEHGLAGEHVEARLERVQVRVHVAVLERDERQAGVRRARVAADQHLRVSPSLCSGSAGSSAISSRRTSR